MRTKPSLLDGAKPDGHWSSLATEAAELGTPRLPIVGIQLLLIWIHSIPLHHLHRSRPFPSPPAGAPPVSFLTDYLSSRREKDGPPWNPMALPWTPSAMKPSTWSTSLWRRSSSTSNAPARASPLMLSSRG
uniref:Uncharacterized protein n=1 Tax=Arundo donax TaxID=35708 RepID=A0A0A9GYP9_ARUDO